MTGFLEVCLFTLEAAEPEIPELMIFLFTGPKLIDAETLSCVYNHILDPRAMSKSMQHFKLEPDLNL